MAGQTKATHHQTRVHNERLVLATVFDQGPISRADVARTTDLTRPTVSDVVTTLMGRDLVVEVGTGPSTGGKAPILLEVPADARHIAVAYIGEFLFQGAIVDLRGRIVSRVDLPVEGRDGDEALAQFTRLLDRVVAMADRPLLGIGIGTPGLANVGTGVVVQAVNLNWRDLPLAEILQERHDLPVHVANDGQVMALAEHVFGGPRTDNLLVVKIGRGIGAGIVLDGMLFRGDDVGAGEIGHTVVVDDGKPCRCGNRGCLETVASTRAVLEEITASNPDVATLADAVREFEAGDPRVRAAILDAARHLGRALAPLVGALNIHRIVLGGLMTSFGESWRQEVLAAMQGRALPYLLERTTIEIADLGEDAVLLGASALLLIRELGLRLPPVDITDGSDAPTPTSRPSLQPMST